MMTKDERERVRALKGLSRWVSTSLRYTPGTIGGIKVDGTTFHHAAFIRPIPREHLLCWDNSPI